MTQLQPLGSRPVLGFGLGLRRELIQPILTQQPKLDWLEVLSDWYLEADTRQLATLSEIRALYPLVMHGGGLSIGSREPLNKTYLARLRALAERLQPSMISDHLCWIPAGSARGHDLRPLPYNRDTITRLVPRIDQVQQSLGQRILLENISDPITRTDDQMPEWEFVAQVAEATDSLILLDLNNIVSNSVWSGFVALEYIRQLPPERIWQIHLAPMMRRNEYDWDADASVAQDPVWQLYQEVIRICGPVATMLERNDDIPPLADLLLELDQARQIARQI
jgi:uncharacterized protein (UPF0276 family)